MKYIVYDNFNGSINLVTDPESDETVVFESLEAAQEEAKSCQNGFIVPLNVDLITLAEDNANTIAFEGLDDNLFERNAEIYGD